MSSQILIESRKEQIFVRLFLVQKDFFVNQGAFCWMTQVQSYSVDNLSRQGGNYIFGKGNFH